MSIVEAERAYNDAVERLNRARDQVNTLAEDSSCSDKKFERAQLKFEAAQAVVESRQRALIDTAVAVDSNGEVVSGSGHGWDGYAFREGKGQRPRLSVREPLTYERGSERSFFHDFYFGLKMNSQEARARLEQHTREMAALNETAGSGGEFVPPLWMMDEWIRLARAARPFANAVNRRPLPPNTNSINFPSVSGGAATAAQSDGGSVQSTDPTTSSLSVPVRTIAGQVDLARQLLDRSVPGMDEVLFDDLARDYATKLDVQTISGSGTAPNAKGILNASGITTITYTSGSPTAYAAWQAVGQGLSKISYSRYLPPQLVVMHPRRWYWFISSLDSQNRPLVVPADQAGINTLALFDTVGAENLVGRVMGLPVIIDASIPTNLGAGTNEDRIIITRTDDVWLFEDAAPRMRLYEEVLSGNLQVRCQVYGYFAFTAERYGAATAVVSGTGLTAPSGY